MQYDNGRKGATVFGELAEALRTPGFRNSERIFTPDSYRPQRRFQWSAVLYWLALPFVLLAMLVVPLMGGHFCPQEALPVLGAAGSLPFIGPAVHRRILSWRRKNTHCCNEDHSER